LPTIAYRFTKERWPFRAIERLLISAPMQWPPVSGQPTGRAGGCSSLDRSIGVR